MEIVEAAHIWPYRGDHDNHPDNGLLLRSDLHTMFDLDLLGIEPGSLAVHLHPSARLEDYARLAGRRLMISRSGRPSADALRSRFDAFHERLND